MDTYEVVKVIGSYATGNVVRESHLVKLDSPVICRGNKTFDLYETDHVIVEALRITDDGETYEETHIVAADEAGTAHDSVLYQAMRALTVPEAMFSIGRNNIAPAEPEPEPEATENADENADTEGDE